MYDCEYVLGNRGWLWSARGGEYDGMYDDGATVAGSVSSDIWAGADV